MNFVILVVLLVGFAGVWAKVPVARVDSFKTYRIQVESKEEQENFRKLGDHLKVSVLKYVGLKGEKVDVVVPPEDQDIFEDRLTYMQYKFNVTIVDLQHHLETVWNKVEGVLNPKMDWTQYHRLNVIYNWLDNQALRHPFTVKRYVIGKSYEGRPIKAIKLSRRPGNKAIFIDANIHAIEYISSAAGTCLFEKLLNSKDATLQNLTLNYDFIFVPIVNPDGYEYTFTTQPLWRKNRKPTGFFNESGICYGVDLNRNWDFHFKEAGYNVDVPCDHWYAGTTPDSEPEVVALEKFILSFPKDYIKIYLALHSYGNLVLLPYGHTDEKPPNYSSMETIAKGFAAAAEVKYGTSFFYGPSGEILYPVSGSGKDWAYGVAQIPFTATIELRDRGTYGFFLPANQIIEVCEELTDGIIGMIKAAESIDHFK